MKIPIYIPWLTVTGAVLVIISVITINSGMAGMPATTAGNNISAYINRPVVLIASLPDNADDVSAPGARRYLKIETLQLVFPDPKSFLVWRGCRLSAE